MNYKRSATVLSNTEIMLLELVAERDELSGYEANRLVSERGYGDWAGVGRTSIYNGLKKLENRNLLAGRLLEAKTGKGPLPRLFSLTSSGKASLVSAVLQGLASAGSQDPRFNLALAGLPLVSPEKAGEALGLRATAIKTQLERVQSKFEAQGGSGLPFHVKALFEHSLLSMSLELTFTKGLRKDLTQNVRKRGVRE